MSEYSKKLASPKWQQRRLEIMQRDNFSCVRCGSNEKHLNVHHKIYLKRREPWQYRDQDLETLCYECHAKEHQNKPIAPAKIWEGIETTKLSQTQEKIRHLQEKLKQPLDDDTQMQILSKLIELQRKERTNG